MKPKRSFLSFLFSFLTFSFALSSVAFAVGSGGFENASFSPNSIAQGNAVVAQSEEPAVISYNPAGIMDLPGVQVQSNTGLISMFTFYDGGSVDQPDTRSSGTIAAVPTAYLTINPGDSLNNRLAFGVGMDSPFGLSNKYDSTHPTARYTGHSNHIKMFSVKPVMAVRVTDKLTLGAGPVWNRVFSAGSIMQYPNTLLVAGSGDGQYRAELSGNSWGWQMGAQYKASEQHHFGFYFRSPSHIQLKGEIDVERSVISGNFKTGARAKMNLPLNFTAGYAWHPNEKTTVELDLGYTHWGQFERLIIHAESVNNFDNAVLAALGAGHADYNDSYSIHLGGSRELNDRLTLRGGGFFYSNTTPDNTFRSAIPDSHSLAFALGLSYSITENLKFDASYLNRFWLPRDVDNSITDLTGIRGPDGNYWSYLQAGYFSFRYLWDAFGDEERDVAVQKEIREAKKGVKNWE